MNVLPHVPVGHVVTFIILMLTLYNCERSETVWGAKGLNTHTSKSISQTGHTPHLICCNVKVSIRGGGICCVVIKLFSRELLQSYVVAHFRKKEGSDVTYFVVSYRGETANGQNNKKLLTCKGWPHQMRIHKLIAKFTICISSKILCIHFNKIIFVLLLFVYM